MPDSTARPHDAKAQSANAKGWLPIAAATAVAAPALVLRGLEVTGIAELGLASIVESAIFGFSILAAATLLIWASEVAERLISATLALAVLAVIAVLPEYAVDLFFAWTAPDNPENAQLALANVEGELYAIDNVCTHDAGPLGEGELFQGHVICPRHGAAFDPKTGKVLTLPAVHDVASFEVTVERDEVYIDCRSGEGA